MHAWSRYGATGRGPTHSALPSLNGSRGVQSEGGSQWREGSDGDEEAWGSCRRCEATTTSTMELGFRVVGGGRPPLTIEEVGGGGSTGLGWPEGAVCRSEGEVGEAEQEEVS
jgi:hypothetical protein